MRDRTAQVEHYRNKAEEVRTIADSMADATAREVLVNVAGDYLMLANVLERSRIPDPLPASE